jgi:hypothetical protein
LEKGDLRTGNWKKFMANAITLIFGGPEPGGRDRHIRPPAGKSLDIFAEIY